MASANARKEHKRASKQLPDLLREKGAVCHYCGRAITLLRGIGREYIEKQTADYVLLKIPGVSEDERKCFIATTDHVIPVRDGGKSEMENLVPACAPCNRKRTATPKSVSNTREDEPV